MTNRTRYFLVGSGLIVTVGLCTGLVAYYGGNLSARAEGPDELSYVPSDVTALAYADVRHIMDSEFRQRLRALIPTGQEKERLLAETGIDLERDIDTVVAGFNPADLGTGGPVVLVRGRFNDSQIESVAVQHGAAVEEYHGKRLLQGGMAGESTSGAGASGIAFLEPGLLALGNLQAVKHAIDVSERHESVANNPDLMRFVAGVVNSGDAWVVGRFDAVSQNGNLPEPIRDQLSSVQWFSLTAGINRALTCRVRAEARDAEAGENMRAVVNGALAVAKMMAGKDARFDGLLDSVQATGSGNGLELSFTVAPEALDGLTGSGRTLPNAVQ